MNERQFSTRAQALRADGVSIRGIADALGVHRGRVERALRSTELRTTVEPAPPFVGRKRELSILRSALRAARAGHGAVAFVVGAPGVGKTRLVRELTADAAIRRVVVATGRSYEDGAAPPYRPWTELLRQLDVRLGAGWLARRHVADRTAISALLPELAPSDAAPAPAGDDPAESRFRLFDALAAVILDAARAAPIVLVFEDLHAADASSLELMAFVGRQLSEARVLLIATYREGELGGTRSSVIARLAREANVLHIELPRLTRDEVAQYVAHAAPGHASEVGEAVYERTDGNAFYVAQVVNLLGDTTSPGMADADAIRRMPEGVRQAVIGRLERLSDDARSVLAVASIVGREFDMDVLGRVADARATERLASLLDMSVGDGILEAASAVGQFRFVHALVHEAIVLEVGPARASELHRRTADAMEAGVRGVRGLRAAEVLAHLVAAGSTVPPERVARCARLAGEQALSASAYV